MMCASNLYYSEESPLILNGGEGGPITILPVSSGALTDAVGMYVSSVEDDKQILYVALALLGFVILMGA